jgi:hypothetical protein
VSRLVFVACIPVALVPVGLLLNRVSFVAALRLGVSWFIFACKPKVKPEKAHWPFSYLYDFFCLA